MADRNFSPAIDYFWIKVQKGIEHASRIYLGVTLFAFFAAVALIALGVRMNVAGLAWVNFVLAAMFVPGVIIAAFYPKIVGSVFGVGLLSPEGWPNFDLEKLIKEGDLPDFQGKAVVREAVKLLRQYSAALAHVSLFAIVTFTALGTWTIREPGVVIAIFVILAGIEMWAALFEKGGVWYRRITIAILLVALAIALWQGYSVLDPIGERYAANQAAQQAAEEKLRKDFFDGVAAINAGKKPSPAQYEAIRLMAGGYEFQYGDSATDANVKKGLSRIEREQEDVWHKNVARWWNGTETTRVLPMGSLRTINKVCGLEPGRYEFTAQSFQAQPVQGPLLLVLGPGILADGVPSGGTIFVLEGECVEVRLAKDQGLDLRTPIYESALRVTFKPTL